jgi:drug/metabolite transporter (DMT)-like permease
VSRGAAHAVLFVALFLVSTSGPFLVAGGIDAYAVVALRMGLAAPLFLGWAAFRGELRITRADLGGIAAGAVLLSLHFVLWVKAFDLTDYASNLVLLVAQPVTVVVLGAWLGERHGREVWLSLGLALAGLVIVAGGDFALGPRALLGDLLCIVGGFAIALFYIVTRGVRSRTPLSAFMGLTFLIGTVLVIPVVVVAGGRVWPYPAASWGWLAALVVITTAGGHGLMNLAARHVKLFTLNIVIVFEPVIGMAIGAMLFRVTVRPLQVVGGAVLAVAVWVALRPKRGVSTS